MLLLLSPENTQNRICAVIVTFNPILAILLELIANIAANVAAIVIVDNGSIKDFSEHFRSDIKVHFHPLPENLGIGAAQNIGIQFAIAHNFTHVLLMDQDSIPECNMIQRLTAALDTLSNQGKRISAVGPRYLDPATGYSSPFASLGWPTFRLEYPPYKHEFIQSDFLISSGSLIALDTLRHVGGMEESLFIDLVDTEWFFRAQSLGYSAFGVPDAIMHHQLGDRVIRVWLGRWRQVPYHSPARHYYFFRNSIHLMRKKHVPLQWILNNSIQLLYMIFFFPIFTAPRFSHLQLMLKGIKDGICGKSGRLD